MNIDTILGFIRFTTKWGIFTLEEYREYQNDWEITRLEYQVYQTDIISDVENIGTAYHYWSGSISNIRSIAIIKNISNGKNMRNVSIFCLIISNISQLLYEVLY